MYKYYLLFGPEVLYSSEKIESRMLNCSMRKTELIICHKLDNNMTIIVSVSEF